MKKNNLYFLLLICYEITRLVLILTTRPEFSIDILPISWYSSVPLLAFPLILVYLMFTHDFPQKKIFINLYSITKILSDSGLVAYCTKAIPLSVSYGKINGYYSLKRSLFLMIFLVIDAILCTVIFLKDKYKENTTTINIVNQNTDDGEN